MKIEHQARLTSSEVATLWSSYLNNSMSICVLQYLSKDIEDTEIKSVLEYALTLSKTNVQITSEILLKEHHPIPVGFTEDDVNLSASRLYSDAVSLYYVKQMSKIALSVYSVALTNAAHFGVRDFLSQAISSSIDLYNKSADILLSKGLFVRTPYVPTPAGPSFVTEQSYLGGFLNIHRRPLNVIEITHVKANIETNIVGQTILSGFIQVAKSKKVRQYFLRGKEISKKHVELFASILLQDDLPAPMEWDLEVTDSTTAPFSDKLMMYHSTALIASGISNYATASAASLRMDVAAVYVRLMAEIAQYAKDGAVILIDNGWLEEPPQNVDRKALAKV